MHQPFDLNLAVGAATWPLYYPKTSQVIHELVTTAANHENVPVTGNTAQTQPENRAFFPALDGLRAIAFLMVFFQHYTSMPWGWTGVNVFFVLSGFLITGILFDTRYDAHRARNFYVRRTLRIFPLYYGILLALLVTYPLMHWHWSLLWLAWPLYLANFLRFLSPASRTTGSPQELAADAHLGSDRLPKSEIYLGHFWSLCVEEQFYLLWPWIVFWVRSRRALLWICGSVVVFVTALRLVVQHTAPAWMLDSELLYRATPFQLDSLLIGAWVALIWRGPHRDRLLFAGRVLAWFGLAAVAVYMAITLLPTPRDAYIHYHYPAWRLTWGLTCIDVLSAALIVACLQPAVLVARVLRLQPLRWLGRISYGAYVLHDLPHGLYVHLVVHGGGRFPFLLSHQSFATATLALPCTLVLAWLSFRFFETPFLNLKDRWTIR